MKVFSGILLVAGAVSTGACLKSEVSHVLYLSPDGAVAWSVREHDVHSDETDPRRRAEEEAGFLRSIHERTYERLVALEALGGLDATTVMTRHERPWEAVTTARFARVDALLDAMFAALGIEGSTRLTSAGARTTLTINWTLDDAADVETPVVALLEELGAYRLVLTEGQFVTAEGFLISADGRVATPVEPAVPGPRKQAATLAWTR